MENKEASYLRQKELVEKFLDMLEDFKTNYFTEDEANIAIFEFFSSIVYFIPYFVYINIEEKDKRQEALEVIMDIFKPIMSKDYFEKINSMSDTISSSSE